MTVLCNPDTEDLPSCLERLELQEMKSRNQSGMPHYEYVGLYYEGKDLILANPDVKVASVNAWQCHNIENYLKEFKSDTSRGRFAISNITEIGSKPSIQSCTLNVYHGQRNSEGFIAIRGHDLSELKEFHVKPYVGDKWFVEDSCDNGILHLRASINEKELYTDQIDISVEVRTCFGSTDAQVRVEDAWRDSYVAYALNRAMGRLLLMQQSEGLKESEECKKAYTVLKSVFEHGTFDISLETKGKHFEAMRELLTEKLETPIPIGIVATIKDALSFAQSTEGVRSKSYVFLSTLLRSCPENLCSVIAGESCISRFANESSSYLYCICDNKLGTLNYQDIVRTIYCLLSDTESQNESVDAWYYERKIYEHVVSEGHAMKSRKWLPEDIVKDIGNRAWKMFKIISACKLLEGFRMAAFIGPENVGKTTLINSILGENVGDVGSTTHTSAATLYRFANDIFIIDFPGTDAGGERAGLSKVWEYYEKVADLCIVVVNFVGDNSKAAEEFVRIARSRMCENVVLVINRVDSVLNGSRNRRIWDENSPQILRELRESFAKSSGLATNQVFLSVSIANEDLEETTRDLLIERGSVIMLKEEITTTIRMLISELEIQDRRSRVE
jgi:GTP-binding protein EngB required for normal cell division